MPSPLQALQTPLDGSQGSAVNFGSPVVNALAGIMGQASGNVDANNGAPILPRSHHRGLLSYTNALGNITNPGVSLFSGYSITAQFSAQVPAGQMAVVSQFLVLSTLTAQLATVNDGVGTYNLFRGYAQGGANQETFGSCVPLPFPMVLDQAWILTVPQSTVFLGYTVVRDTAITPVMRAVTTTTTYTVPQGKTLWLYGCLCPNTVTTASNSAQLLLNANLPLCKAWSYWDGTGAGNCYPGAGSAIPGPEPIPIPAGSVLSGSDPTQGLTFWGVLI